MLTLSSITFKFPGASTPLLQNISFIVNAGEKVGLIGPNGCGKSTLLKIIMGQIVSTSGSVILNPPDLRIGYLEQGLTTEDSLPIGSVLIPQQNAWTEANQRIDELTAQMETASDAALDELLEAYSIALEEIERLQTDHSPGQAEMLFSAMGLAHLSLETPVGMLSGGQKTRLGLAALLLRNPQFLVLDEPTNHLDMEALAWLSDWLSDFDGGVLIVSHDRAFLDDTVDQIVALDPISHTAQVYDGDYSNYAATIRSEQDKLWAKWRDQQIETARLQTDVANTMARAIRKENATRDSTQRRYAKKVAKRAKAKEKRLERYLASSDRVEKPRQTWHLKLDFVDLPTTGQDVVTLQNLSIGYVSDAPLLCNLNLAIRAGERVAIVGPNGHGKSTLIKTIRGEIPPLAGAVRHGSTVKIGYLAQEQDILNPTSNALEMLHGEVEMAETAARSFLHFFLFAGDDVFTPVAQLSYGERSRLMLALLVARGANLLILDEPVNHLDVSAREQFEQALRTFRGSVLAVSHDHYFIDHYATTIWHIADGGLTTEIREPLLA